MRIQRLALSGYRAIAARVDLVDLGPYVALYGDNATGKSSILQGLELLGRLCEAQPGMLLGSGHPWPETEFYEYFGQDVWMFNNRSEDHILLHAMTDTGLEVCYKLLRTDLGISVKYQLIRSGDRDLLPPLERAQVAVERAKEEVTSRHERDPEEEYKLFEAVEAAQHDLTAALQDIQDVLRPLRVGHGVSPKIPVPDELRESLFSALLSKDASQRNRARLVLRSLKELFPALGAGDFDVFENPPTHPKDLAWIEQTVIPMDRLGGGVQSAVFTVTSLLESGARVVELEEPEAFIGTWALQGLSAVLHQLLERHLCDQIWLATHSVGMVTAEDPLYILERNEHKTTARKAHGRDLGRFAQALAPNSTAGGGRLAQDGSVSIPPAFIQKLGLRPGDFVYFSQGPDGIRLLNGEQMDALWPDEGDGR